MKKELYALLLLLFPVLLTATANPDSSRYEFSISLGQYPASLATPRLSPLHPGGQVGLHRAWNHNERHRLTQAGYLGFFSHPDLQDAVQLYTEIGYTWQISSGLAISPLAVGGGYVLSASRLRSFNFDPQSNTYEAEGRRLRHNWLVSLGGGLGYQFSGRYPLRLGLHYRIQVQGILVRNTVPIIAYTPLFLRFTVPF